MLTLDVSWRLSPAGGKMKLCRTPRCSLMTVALAAYSGVAASAGFQLQEQNASGLGNAYAGQAASAQDASTIFFNPAGMTFLPGRNVVGAVNFVKPSVDFTNTGSTRASPLLPLGDNGGDAGDWAAIPNLYYSWQINPQLFVGLGVNVPFGLKTEYDPTWVGRFHAITSEFKTINFNPSVALKLSDALSVGVGVNFQRADAKLSNAVNFGALGEGTATVKGHDTAWGWNAGIMYSVTPDTRIGAAYRSSMGYKIDANVTFANRPAVLGGVLPDGAVTADVTLPATASLSLFHRLTPQWDLLADVSWTDWSTLGVLNIVRDNGRLLSTTPLHWKDSWRVSAGANYHYNSAWTFRMGAAYDQTPINETDRTPRVPDNDRTWLAVGAQYRFSKQLALDAGYAYIFVKDSSTNLCNPPQAAANPPACAGKNNLVGTSDNDINIVSLQLRYTY
jgi:long-chain fatty acid transport protein